MRTFQEIIKTIRERDGAIGYDQNEEAVQRDLSDIITSDDYTSHQKGTFCGFVALRAFERFDNAAEAVSLAETALEYKSENWRASYVLAFDALYQGKDESFATYLTKALSNAPNNATLLKGLCSYSFAYQDTELLETLLKNCTNENQKLEIQSKLDRFCAPIPSRLSAGKKGLFMLSGISHCGSTYLGNFIGSHSDVDYLGETHRLALLTEEARGVGIKESPTKFIRCHICQDHECSQFPDVFREKLKEDPTHYYMKVAEKCDVKIVLFGDKNYVITRDLDPRVSFDEIILFKSPYNAYMSRFKRNPIDDPTELSNDIRKYLKIYANNYANLMLNEAPQHGVLYLNWESFTAMPTEHIPIISEFFGFELDADLLGNFVIQSHSFGGNSDVNTVIKERASALIKQSGGKMNRLIEVEVSKYPYPSIIYERLMARYHKDFSL